MPTYYIIFEQTDLRSAEVEAKDLEDLRVRFLRGRFDGTGRTLDRGHGRRILTVREENGPEHRPDWPL